MKLLTNILLFITSIILAVLLTPLSIIHILIDAIRYGSFYRRINYSLLSFALSIDIGANAAFSSMLNAYFLKSNGGYYFGERGETISSALGKNLMLNKLTWIGKGLAGILNLLDENHCYKSIKDEAYLLLPKPEKVKIKYTISAFIVSIVMLYVMFKLFMWII